MPLPKCGNSLILKIIQPNPEGNYGWSGLTSESLSNPAVPLLNEFQVLNPDFSCNRCSLNVQTDMSNTAFGQYTSITFILFSLPGSLTNPVGYDLVVDHSSLAKCDGCFFITESHQ